MRKIDRRKQQKQRRQWVLVVTAIFMLVCFVTFFTLKIVKGRQVEEAATVQSSTKETVEKISQASSVTSESSSAQQEPVTSTVSTESSSTAEEPKAVILDDSGLIANASQVSYGVYYFSDDTYISNQNSIPTPSASVIKVFIMSYIFETNMDMQTIVNGEPLSELTRRMIQNSDNSATNAIIDQIGMEQLNAYFQTSGYTDTQLQRKMLDEQAVSMGKENYTSLNDTMAFLKKVYQNRGAYPYSSMLELMLGQQVRTKIPSKLPGDVVVANKTGELPSVENDIGLVMSEDEPFAIVVLSNGVTNSGGMRDAIGNFTLIALR
ncbi:serine hydrolase [Enterococcus sp. 669A]|uniref:Serine hydrolase n=1 Tax=Candidatus Enterococcus moelleringii TaxID=2815325 RepID=A0ABS3L860_9ENTE|nr:serine hydrolase [Enterococcus sp. 669A]MBO1305280.1 serine hydrolase [Enterococcus sp. 669A]